MVSADLSVPKATGGPGRQNAATPEHPFAAGYAACFGYGGCVHTLSVIAIGMGIMLLFLIAAHFVNKSRGVGFIDGGRLFIWFWLVTALLCGAYNLFAISHGLLVELMVFVVVFGAPAGVSWYLSRMIRCRHAPPVPKPDVLPPRA